MGNHLRALAAFLIAFNFAAASLAADVTDNTNGYTVRLPDGWKQIPNPVLQQMRGTVSKPGAAAPNFVAAFEPASHDSPFTYPYVMVQIQPYPAGTNIATISRAEVQDLTTKLTGLPASELKRNLSDDAAKMMGDARIGGATVINDPPAATTPRCCTSTRSNPTGRTTPPRPPVRRKELSPPARRSVPAGSTGTASAAKPWPAKSSVALSACSRG